MFYYSSTTEWSALPFVWILDRRGFGDGLMTGPGRGTKRFLQDYNSPVPQKLAKIARHSADSMLLLWLSQLFFFIYSLTHSLHNILQSMMICVNRTINRLREIFLSYVWHFEMICLVCACAHKTKRLNDFVCIYHMMVIMFTCTQTSPHINVTVYIINISISVSDYCVWLAQSPLMFILSDTEIFFKSAKNEITKAYCGHVGMSLLFLCM